MTIGISSLLHYLYVLWIEVNKMNRSYNESKVKQARKKSIEINHAARYDKIEKESQDPKLIERWFRKAYGKIGEEFNH